MGNQDKKRYIRVAVNSESVVCGIKKNSTCDDVIKMVMGPTVNERNYALFESSYGVEQRINGSMKIFKQMETWGADLYHYSLVIRQIDSEVESKIAATASRSKTRLRLIREMLTKKKKKYHRSNTTIFNNLDRIDPTGITDKCFEKNLRGFVSHSHMSNTRVTRQSLSPRQLREMSEEDRKSGKLELLRRYMIDVNQFQVDEKGQRRKSLDNGELHSLYGKSVKV